MITLDEQIEFVDHAAQSWAKYAQSGDGFTMAGERFAASRLDMLSAILATLRSVKQAEPVAWPRTERRPNLLIFDDLIEQHKKPAAAPDGWVLVPKEPTDQMLAVWLEPEERNNSTMYFWSRALRRYGNMLAVAPAAPQSPGREG